MPRPKLTYYEFFAGGGMVRAGLGGGWRCLLANDFNPKKAAAYAANWGADHLRIGDVAALGPADLPGQADLAWASFPCQDLSLAGNQAGLVGPRSGTFWAFHRLMTSLGTEGRGPKIIALENVCGALTSHNGKDFAAIGDALAQAGYRFGALVIDAALFLPQSRPRLFVVAARKDIPLPKRLLLSKPTKPWHSVNLQAAYETLPSAAKSAWVWWNLPQPNVRRPILSALIDEVPEGVKWHTLAETRRLLRMMTPRNTEKVQQAGATGKRAVGGIYRRTRTNTNGEKVQRAEVRFDDTAGCLRTPAGGSSRQTIIIVDGEHVRTRLLAAREAARLMGLPDTYKLPTVYNEAYHLAGDGVAVPVVRHLAACLLEPLLR